MSADLCSLDVTSFEIADRKQHGYLLIEIIYNGRLLHISPVNVHKTLMILIELAEKGNSMSAAIRMGEWEITL